MKDHSENRTENRTNNCKNQSQNRTTNQTTNEHKHPNQYTVFQCGKQRAFAFYFWFGSNCCHRASNSSSTRAICPVR